MGLKNWLYKNFNSSYYNKIEQSYNQAKITFAKGYAHFISENNSVDSPDDFDFKRSVSENLDVIEQYDKVIIGYENLKLNYRRGFDFFLEKRKLKDNNRYSIKKEIFKNGSSIEQDHTTFVKYDNLSRNYPKGLDLFLKELGKLPPFSIDIETRRLACKEMQKIISYNSKYASYVSIKSKYKEGFLYYCSHKDLLNDDSLQTINKILCDETVIADYDKVLSEYKAIQAKNKNGILLYLGVKNLSQVHLDKKRIVMKHKSDVVALQAIYECFVVLKESFPKSINYYLAGREISKELVHEIASKKELFQISEEYINKANGVPAIALNLFGLKVKDAKDISETLIEKKRVFLDYKKVQVKKPAHPLFAMSNSAKAAIQATLNTSKVSHKFKEINTDTLELCNVIQVLYAHKWTLDKAKTYIKENRERILLYYKQHNMEQEISVATLKHVVTDSQLIKYIGAAEEEKRIRESIISLKHNHPKGFSYFVKTKKIKQYTDNLPLEDCETIIKYENKIKLKNNEIVAEEEERKRYEAEFSKAYQKASSLKQSSPKGFDYYVRIGRIASLSNSMSLQQLKDIVAMESSVISKHKEIERKEIEERRQREERERVEKAKNLATNYSRAFSILFPNISRYFINSSNCGQILDKESKLRSLNNLFTSVSNWDEVKSIPYYFFYYYYPTRFGNVSMESLYARRIIYNFKDGRAHNEVANLMSQKLRQTFSTSELSDLTLVCIPASTRSVNESRYESFSNDLCRSTGMKNGFEYIEITREKTPSHMGGTDSATYSVNRNFFNGAKVVLFDDVVTRGHSMAQFMTLLEGAGATVICALSIGRTYSDYYGDNRQPHPWTGNL